MAWIRPVLVCLLLSAFGATLPRPAAALSDQQELIEKCRLTFEKLITSPEFKQLPDFVKRSRAVLIFPSLVKGGFILGAEGGSGVLVARDAKKGWGYPAFYMLIAGSLGLQIGGQLSEVVFTVMNDRAIDALLVNQMKFGGNMSIAVGPLGSGLQAATTTNFEADVYSFGKTAGLFGGVSFDGAGVLQRNEWNAAYYGQGATSSDIVIAGKYSNPNAEGLRKALEPY